MHLVVRMSNSGKVTIDETSRNVLAAVALAADRAGRVIGRNWGGDEVQGMIEERSTRCPMTLHPSNSLDAGMN